MKSFGITDRGKVRRDNQDSFLIERIDEKDCLIAVLCDGMGGEKAGNIASDLAAKTYVGELSQKMKITRQKKPDMKAMMIQACHLANHMIYGYSCFDTDYTGMGTTMVSAVVVGDDVYVLNVGDSRAYRITRRKMVQITRDHSLVQDMVDRGEITPEQARTHPRRNVITRALGVDEDTGARVCHGRWPVQADLVEGLIPEGATLCTRDHLYLTDGETRVLAEQDGCPAIATHTFGRGRGIYLAGFAYSPENARMLLNLMLWATGTDSSRVPYLTDNAACECAWFPAARRLVVINNTEQAQTTVIHTPEGDVRAELAPFATRMIQR